MRHAPENTMPAFAACVELSMGFELDVYSSRDDQLVVIHDATLKRTAGGPDGPVGEFTLEELKRLDAGSWFHPSFRGVRIPTFEEVAAIVSQRKRGPTMLAINIKQITREARAIWAASVRNKGSRSCDRSGDE
jgi:glycerophosphoryl diester phosphodiesterase